jgi:hypothetical protein
MWEGSAASISEDAGGWDPAYGEFQGGSRGY